MDTTQCVLNHGQLRLTVGDVLGHSTPARMVGSTLEVHGAKRKGSPIVVESELRRLCLDVPDPLSQRT